MADIISGAACGGGAGAACEDGAAGGPGGETGMDRRARTGGALLGGGNASLERTEGAAERGGGEDEGKWSKGAVGGRWAKIGVGDASSGGERVE